MKKLFIFALVILPFISKAQAHTKEGVLHMEKDSTFNVLIEYNDSGNVHHALGRATIKSGVIHWFIKRNRNPRDTTYIPFTGTVLWYSRINNNLNKSPNY